MGKHHNFKAKPFALVIKINSEKKVKILLKLKFGLWCFELKKKKKVM